jgi:hypothetical protein
MRCADQWRAGRAVAGAAGEAIVSSAITPLWVAVRTALLADASIAFHVGTRVYGSTAPPSAILPRITIDSPTETNDDVLNADGNANSLTIHIWWEGTADDNVLMLAAHVERVLNKQRLTVSGRRHVNGTTSLVGVARDPDLNVRVVHGVMIYQSVTRV